MRFISAMIRRGSIGTSFERSNGSQKLRQSMRQPSISFCQAPPKTVPHAFGARDPHRLGQESLGVADHADLDRIVAADLLGVDVDLDEAWSAGRCRRSP